MDTSPRPSSYRGATVLLAVLVTLAWIATVALPVTVFVLLRGVDAPADRTTVIVLGAALTPALAAVGLTVGLVVLRRHARGSSRFR
ncbi:hypothetical protein [Curtobacterium pusillum]|uniref:hypothetical protein n=1 Tax=Curtobacterium pusillum TaxID=69373 RepID=UPI001643C37D|nr:hypothetical protein [Curtobacterium pusillum]